MAERAFGNISGVDTYNGAVIGQWTGLLNGDTGVPVKVPLYADKTVQVDSAGATWGTGGAMVLEGSLDGVTYFTLNDPQGNALTFATGTTRIEAILENVVFLRPRVSGGDGTTSLSMKILAR